MSLSDPTKPWAIVLLHLIGTEPPASVSSAIAQLFERGAFGSRSLADYWSDQTFGAVSLSGSTSYPATGWQPCDWDIFNYPGLVPANVENQKMRSALAEQATKRVTDLNRYRGVIAVFNFQCSGGNVGGSGGNVVWGLDCYGSRPAWGDASWLRCVNCQGLLQAAGASSPCPSGGTHDVAGSREHITVTDKRVPQLRTLDRCAKCGLLYAAELQAQAVECAARASGRQHASSGQTVDVLSKWPDPPGDRYVGTCRLCRLVLHHPPIGNPGPCPASSTGHDIEQTILALPYADMDLSGARGVMKGSRGFLAHEMGHAYGFDHGRGIAPRSEDVFNDDWPGAYGDPYDMMSYPNVDSYTPAAGAADEILGNGGPGFALHHLLDPFDQSVFPGFIYRGGGPEFQTLRPAVTGTGVLSIKFDGYIAEFRRRDAWDAGIKTDSPAAPGAVVVYHQPDDEDLYVQVPSTIGRNFLAQGDSFETRLGMGNTRLTVEQLDRSGARVSLWPLSQSPASRTFQRWLVIPCRHSDSSTVFDLGKVRRIVEAVEEYWNAMAEWSFSVRGYYVMTAGQDAWGNDPVTLPWSLADDARMAPADRVRGAIDAALSLPYPTNPEKTKAFLWMDWRWFTGIVILRANGGGVGEVNGSPISLEAGCLKLIKPLAINFVNAPRYGYRLPALPYDVIEMSLDDFSHASLARCIGRTLGFGDRANDPYDLMGPVPGALQYTAPATGPRRYGSPDWGAMGPGLGSSQLLERGWLPQWEVKTVETESGSGPRPAVGSVQLTPLHRAGTSRTGIVRAEIGPYSFELRIPSGWDSGLSDPVVLAIDSSGTPEALRLNESVQWGTLIPVVGGGGHVTVDAISAQSATLSYYAQERPIFVAGGGTLYEGDTILFGFDGSIHRIPPGDPYEHRVEELINSMQDIVSKMRLR